MRSRIGSGSAWATLILVVRIFSIVYSIILVALWAYIAARKNLSSEYLLYGMPLVVAGSSLILETWDAVGLLDILGSRPRPWAAGLILFDVAAVIATTLAVVFGVFGSLMRQETDEERQARLDAWLGGLLTEAVWLTVGFVALRLISAILGCVDFRMSRQRKRRNLEATIYGTAEERHGRVGERESKSEPRSVV